MAASTRSAVPGAGGGRGPAQEPAPSCAAPEARALLVPYACAACSPQEAEILEAHLLACDRCFEDLKILDWAGALIREYTAGHPEALGRLGRASRGRRASPPGAR